MTTDADHNSFGRYLRQHRIEKGIPLEKISAETRIGIKILQLIENENHERLPADVFVKGFLRAYAKAIGADGDEALRLYVASLSGYREKVQQAVSLQETGLRFWTKLLVSLGALGCLVAASVFMPVLFQEKGHAPEPEALPAKPAVAVPAAAAPEASHPPDPLPPSGKAPADKFLLAIRVVENTWLKITVDDLAAREYSLKPGERLELEAVSGFKLLLGNAAGVKLKLNGSPVPIDGKPGDVVKIHLP